MAQNSRQLEVLPQPGSTICSSHKENLPKDLKRIQLLKESSSIWVTSVTGTTGGLTWRRNNFLTMISYSVSPDLYLKVFFSIPVFQRAQSFNLVI